MKTRIVHTRIWEDEFFIALSREAKILFLYLITNQRINLVGCYQVLDRVILFDTGLLPEELERAKRELNPKVRFNEGWVYIQNAAKLGGYSGASNNLAFSREFDSIPQYVIDCLAVDTLPPPSLHSVYTPINHKSEIINNKSKTINHKSEESVPQEVLDKGFTHLREIIKEVTQ